MSELPGGWLPPQPPSWPPAPPEPQPQRPVFVKPGAGEPTSGLVVTALVCSTLSLVLLVLSVGVACLFSLPLGAAGWTCAARARRDAPSGPKTALVLSIAAVALSALAALVWIALLVAGVTPEDLQRSLEHELERQRQAS